MELGTLAAVQVPLLMFSTTWTNYLPLWRVQFLHLLFEGWGEPNGGFHTPFTFLPREVLHGTSMQKAELLGGSEDCIPQLHPPSISSPTPPRDPLGPLEEPLGTVEHNLKNMGSDLKSPCQPLG